MSYRVSFPYLIVKNPLGRVKKLARQQNVQFILMRIYHHNRENEELQDQIRNSEVNLRILAGLEPKGDMTYLRGWKLREELWGVLLAGPSRF